jgi:hypothetical protein
MTIMDHRLGRTATVFASLIVGSGAAVTPALAAWAQSAPDTAATAPAAVSLAHPAVTTGGGLRYATIQNPNITSATPGEATRTLLTVAGHDPAPKASDAQQRKVDPDTWLQDQIQLATQNGTLESALPHGNGPRAAGE